MALFRLSLIILLLQAVMLFIGYLTINASASGGATIDSDYIKLYMLGYSMPLLAVGTIVFASFAIVFRKSRKVTRKVKAVKAVVVNHRIPVYENS